MVDHVPEELLPGAAAATLAEKDNALRVKRAYENFVAGGKARSSYLPRELIAGLAFATVDLMLLRIVNGTVKPKSAKEAAEVARIAHELARKEVGEADARFVISSPEERAKALARLQEMHQLVRQRALEAGQDGQPIEDAIVVEEDAAPTPDPDLEFGGIPQTVAVGDALVIVRARSDSPA